MDTQPTEQSPLEIELRKLDMQTGQTLLISVPSTYSQASMDAVRRQMLQLIPDGCAVVVVPPGVAFHILGEEPSPSRRRLAIGKRALA